MASLLQKAKDKAKEVVQKMEAANDAQRQKNVQAAKYQPAVAASIFGGPALGRLAAPVIAGGSKLLASGQNLLRNVVNRVSPTVAKAASNPTTRQVISSSPVAAAIASQSGSTAGTAIRNTATAARDAFSGGQAKAGPGDYSTPQDGGQNGGDGGYDSGAYSGGDGGYQLSPEEQAELTMQEATQTIQDLVGNYLEFDPGNPFSLDEAFAKNALLARISPYYAQTFGEFLKGVQSRASRSKDDENKMLSELQAGTEFFTGRSGRLLGLAQRQARQGFAESGLFESGQRRKAEGLLAVERGNEQQNFLRGQGAKEDARRSLTRRTLEDLQLEQEQKARETAQAQETDVQTGLAEARRQSNTDNALKVIESYGPAPGENPGDFLNRRADVFRQYI